MPLIIEDYISKIFKDVHPSWKRLFTTGEIGKIYNNAIASLNNDLISKGVTKDNIKKNGLEEYIRPAPECILQAFKYFDINNVRAIIVGQDPYPKKYHASGLAFSISNEIDEIAASLKKGIYPALKESKFIDYIPAHGNLEEFAAQGVLMLNIYLTRTPEITKDEKGVYINGPGSANKKNIHKFWKEFTISIIKYVTSGNLHTQHKIPVMLWGEHAKKISSAIGENGVILTWRHPSPASALSATHPEHFSNCDNFIKTNEILHNQNLPEINWNPDVVNDKTLLNNQFITYKLIEGNVNDFIKQLVDSKKIYNDQSGSEENKFIKEYIEFNKKRNAEKEDKEVQLERLEILAKATKTGEIMNILPSPIAPIAQPAPEVSEVSEVSKVSEISEVSENQKVISSEPIENTKHTKHTENIDDSENHENLENLEKHTKPDEPVERSDSNDSNDSSKKTEEIDSIIVFTDGGCKGNGKASAKAGMGIYFPVSFNSISNGYLNTSEKLSSTHIHGPLPECNLSLSSTREIEFGNVETKATNQRAELLAAVMGLERIIKKLKTEGARSVKPIILVTDSEYAIKWISYLLWDSLLKNSKLDPQIANRDIVIMLYHSLSALYKLYTGNIKGSPEEKRNTLVGKINSYTWKSYFSRPKENKPPNYNSFPCINLVHVRSHVKQGLPGTNYYGAGETLTEEKQSVVMELKEGNDEADRLAELGIFATQNSEEITYYE